jgi:hypothetical protein
MSQPTSTNIGEIPRFCPECGRAAIDRAGNALCDHCGTRLAMQGYCPICEARVRRRAGESCPKHDVELLADEPAPWPSVPADSGVSWVTVKRFPDSLAAAAARIRLDAEGIPTFLEGERMGAPAMYRVATGGVKLQVPAEQAADARVILSQDWSWPGDEPELEDGPEGGEGEPAALEAGSGRALVVELLIIGTLAIPLIGLLLMYLQGR